MPQKNWRQFKKGDLVFVWGIAKGGHFSYIPAFVYETQRMKDIIQVYAFGDFDEWSSSYVETTQRAEEPALWFRACEEAGYSKEYVLQKMQDFHCERSLTKKLTTNTMGQYFKAVNLDKKEFVCPWAIGGAAKLWEWCVNRQAGIFPFLLRKSNEGGGGDIEKDYQTTGRWAGDRIVLIGDYDESKLWDKLEKEYTDISRQLVEDYNDFVQIDEAKLKYTPPEKAAN